MTGCLLAGLLLITLGCPGPPDVPPADDAEISQQGPATAIQTDTTVYFLEWDGRGWRTQIPYRYQNTGDDTLYVVNCNGASTIAVEKKEPAGWRPVWVPLTNACLSPPITIPPGETLTAPLSLWGAPPGGNVGPEFSDTTFDGVYRLVWWNVVFHYDQDRREFGDTVPLKDRVSNEFTLRPRR